MNEPRAPAGPRWNAPGWAEADLSDSAEVSALKAALESASQRADEWRQAYERLESESFDQHITMLRAKNRASELEEKLKAKENKVFGIGFAYGFLVALALYGILNWYGYVG